MNLPEGKPWLLYSNTPKGVKQTPGNENTYINSFNYLSVLVLLLPLQGHSHLCFQASSLISLSLAVAGVAGAVRATLAAVFACNTRFSTLILRLCGCYSHDESFSCGHLRIAEVRVVIATATAAAALASGSATAVSSTARHFPIRTRNLTKRNQITISLTRESKPMIDRKSVV